MYVLLPFHAWIYASLWDQLAAALKNRHGLLAQVVSVSTNRMVRVVLRIDILKKIFDKTTLDHILNCLLPLPHVCDVIFSIFAAECQFRVLGE